MPDRFISDSAALDRIAEILRLAPKLDVHDPWFSTVAEIDDIMQDTGRDSVSD